MKSIDEESTEEMPVINLDPFEEIPEGSYHFDGPKHKRAVLFLGVTSGSFLAGFSAGYIFSAGTSTSMVNLVGVSGTTMVAYSYFEYWFMEKRN